MNNFTSPNAQNFDEVHLIESSKLLRYDEWKRSARNDRLIYTEAKSIESKGKWRIA